MSYSDELFDKQFGLAQAIMGCDDPTEIKELFDEFFFYSFQWYQLFAPHKVASKLKAKHFSFAMFLEAAGIADAAVTHGGRVPPTIDSVARVFRLFPPLKTYCEEHFLNGGVIGALKYGESYPFGHDVVIPALSLINE
jgi:hypothetical protein